VGCKDPYKDKYYQFVAVKIKDNLSLINRALWTSYKSL